LDIALMANFLINADPCGGFLLVVGGEQGSRSSALLRISTRRVGNQTSHYDQAKMNAHGDPFEKIEITNDYLPESRR
jgi:hypothetical protein